MGYLHRGMTLPQQIGPYRILRRLGIGGMAEVFLAEAYGASGFCKRVAIKVLLPDAAVRVDIVKSLIEEARLGARLSHRNLIQIHDLGVADGLYYIRMDYADGGALSDLAIPSLKVNLDLALYLAEEIALGLAYLHQFEDESGRAMGLVHRDVSPSNVLLSRSGEVKLSDFGLAKVTTAADVTRGNVRKGKYAYMSPEQIAGERATAASDQFSFGVLLHELVCGVRPFDGETVHQTMANIVAANASFDSLPSALRPVVTRCLAREVTNRYPSTAALLGEISDLRRKCAASGSVVLANLLSHPRQDS